MRISSRSSGDKVAIKEPLSMSPPMPATADPDTAATGSLRRCCRSTSAWMSAGRAARNSASIPSTPAAQSCGACGTVRACCASTSARTSSGSAARNASSIPLPASGSVPPSRAAAAVGPPMGTSGVPSACVLGAALVTTAGLAGAATAADSIDRRIAMASSESSSKALASPAAAEGGGPKRSSRDPSTLAPSSRTGAEIAASAAPDEAPDARCASASSGRCSVAGANGRTTAGGGDESTMGSRPSARARMAGAAAAPSSLHRLHPASPTSSRP
mmetsp:Transcript_74774/g.200422  ORF Transcript_74774/g.200422 Transcript_74774/m.200422 type:complete len:273 (+) Transcript_74774:1065-1883(+)